MASGLLYICTVTPAKAVNQQLKDPESHTFKAALQPQVPQGTAHLTATRCADTPRLKEIREGNYFLM